MATSRSASPVTNGFEQVLYSTLKMIRSRWNVPTCLFLQVNDNGTLYLRASDGLPARKGKQRRSIQAQDGAVSRCLKKNAIIVSGDIPLDKGLAAILKNGTGKNPRYVIVPVSGQTRPLGVLMLGPIRSGTDMKSKEGELRSAGTLCAVISAYLRLYDWMAHFLPQLNHQIRTPLTAVQGSLGMILGGVYGELDSEVKAMLEVAHKGCLRTVSALEECLVRENPTKKQA